MPPESAQPILKGRVLVEWDGADRFIFRKSHPTFSFRPSWWDHPIIPCDMYTDGGSVPQTLWDIPGLSPWALGPAYVVHDWIYEVHHCRQRQHPDVAAITFEQSADILGEVAIALADLGLVDDRHIDKIVWATKTRITRLVWDHPRECRRPPPPLIERRRTISDFVLTAEEHEP